MQNTRKSIERSDTRPKSLENEAKEVVLGSTYIICDVL